MPVPEGKQLYWFDTPRVLGGCDALAFRPELQFDCRAGDVVYYAPDTVDSLFVDAAIDVRANFVRMLNGMGVDVLGSERDVMAINYADRSVDAKVHRWHPVVNGGSTTMVKSTFTHSILGDRKSIGNFKGVVPERVVLSESAVRGDVRRQFLTFAPDLRGWHTGEELLKGGEVDRADLVLFVADAMEGCENVHEGMRFIHGDVKLDNIIGKSDGVRYRGHLNDFEYAIPRGSGIFAACQFMTPYTCTPYVSPFFGADVRYIDMSSFAVALMKVLKGNDKWLNSLFAKYMRYPSELKLASGKEIADAFLELLVEDDELTNALRPILRKMFEATDYSYTLADAYNEVMSLQNFCQ